MLHAQTQGVQYAIQISVLGGHGQGPAKVQKYLIITP